MNIMLEQLRRDYLALMGESPGLSPVLEEGEESSVLELEEKLKVRLLPLAIEATMETPLLWLDDLEEAEIVIEWTPDRRGCRLRLPSDYMRLYSLHMGGWKEAVTEIEPADSLRTLLGEECPRWMACEENPLVLERRDNVGRYLSVTGAAYTTPEAVVLLYVPFPYLTEKKLRISGAAYPLLLEKLVSEG